MKNLTTLLEQLNLQQYNYVKNKLGGNYYRSNDNHYNMFHSYPDLKNSNRIVLPYEEVPVRNSDIDMNLRTHLAKNGWGIHNYRAGLASHIISDRDGNPKLEIKKIGKVLQETGGDKVLHPEMRSRLVKGGDGKPLVGDDGRFTSEQVPQSLLDFYNNDPKRDNKNGSNITISRGMEDIAGMTSGRTWEADSCMRLPYSATPPRTFHKHIKDDLANSSLVAYSTKIGDDDIESPMGRVTIKKYVSTQKVKGSYHHIFRPEHTTYGNVPPNFIHQVNSIMEQHYPAINDVKYELAKGLYNDGRKQILPIKVGMYKEDGTYQNYNNKGNLEDYTDENGNRQPAVKSDGLVEHYKDGKLHNEDGAAKIEKVSNGEIHYHAINGEYHKLGEPAIKFHAKSDINNSSYSRITKMEEYMVGGAHHREGDNPARINRYNDGNALVSYHKFGLEHRDNGKPSHTEHMNGVTTVRRKTYGQFNSPDNKTPSNLLINNDYRMEEYHKNGKLHRDNDRPASIEDTKDYEGRNVTIKKWYQNGISKRDDNSKPHTVTTDMATKEIVRKEWNRPKDSKLPNSVSVNAKGDASKSYSGALVNGGLYEMKKYVNGDIKKTYFKKYTEKSKRGAFIYVHSNGLIDSDTLLNETEKHKIMTDDNGNTHFLKKTNGKDNIVVMIDGTLKRPHYNHKLTSFDKTMSPDEVKDEINNAKLSPFDDNEIRHSHNIILQHLENANNTGYGMDKIAKQIKKKLDKSVGNV